MWPLGTESDHLRHDTSSGNLQGHAPRGPTWRAAPAGRLRCVATASRAFGSRPPPTQHATRFDHLKRTSTTTEEHPKSAGRRRSAALRLSMDTEVESTRAASSAGLAEGARRGRTDRGGSAGRQARDRVRDGDLLGDRRRCGSWSRSSGRLRRSSGNAGPWRARATRDHLPVLRAGRRHRRADRRAVRSSCGS